MAHLNDQYKAGTDSGNRLPCIKKFLANRWLKDEEQEIMLILQCKMGESV